METTLKKLIFDGPISKPYLYDVELVQQIENKKLALTVAENRITEFRQTFIHNYVTKMVWGIRCISTKCIIDKLGGVTSLNNICVFNLFSFFRNPIRTGDQRNFYGYGF